MKWRSEILKFCRLVLKGEATHILTSKGVERPISEHDKKKAKIVVDQTFYHAIENGILCGIFVIAAVSFVCAFPYLGDADQATRYATQLTMYSAAAVIPITWYLMGRKYHLNVMHDKLQAIR